ncbi:MAG: serine/threonine protein kinase, partial [Schwartzia sp.]|nr:serine/threonine protein kinase [Schwartzia sp. (in: firmicutes)]
MLQGVLDNRYEILERIGGGGMADVYKAHDKILDRVVAVKILHAQLAGDKEFLAKFQMEAQGAARLSHPNIVNIYDVGVEDGMHYIVMEYVDGETLKDKITREGHLSIPESLKIAKEIAEALSHAHKNNLVHCDVKPHNILVMQDGRVKVADFGIARAVTSTTMTYNGNVVGSVHYFSPEQAKGTKITPKSDVYSLGVVLYEMLTGHLP